MIEPDYTTANYITAILAATIAVIIVVTTNQRIRNKSFNFVFGTISAGYIVFFLSYGCILEIASDEENKTLCAIIGGAIIWVLFVTFVLFCRWVCCWRNFKKFLIGLGCFMILVALFYAEENWRGKSSWEKFKIEHEAKGEKFKLTELAPPPVPDDHNFAMTPIVASSYIWEVDRNGHKLESPDTNAVNRLMMPIDADSELSPWPTNGGGAIWQKAKLSDLKAWQEYYRALSAKTNLFPIPHQLQTPAADILTALSKYDSEIDELRQASHLPYSRFPVEYGREDPADVLLPHLAGIKGCVVMLKMRAAAELQAGQSEQALADVHLGLRLADSIRNEPILISHLVRIAIWQIMLNAIWEGLAEHHWSDTQLVELDRELQKMDFLADHQFALRGERATTLGTLIWLRQGQLDSSGEDAFGEKRIEKAIAIIYRLMPKGWSYQEQLVVAKVHQEYFLKTIAPKKHLVSPKIARDGKQYIESMPLRPWNIIARFMLPTYTSTPNKFAHAQGSLDLGRIAIALERYKLVHGNYPDSLDVLAPQFLPQVPHDVIGGQPLHYQRTEDGQFILYSIGWNEKDDGGVVGLRESGSVDMEKGDWVWRYPEQSH